MRKKSGYITGLCFLLLIGACKKDNYDPPGSKFTGALVYKGDSVRVSYGDVTFQLWQSGWGKLTPINVNVAQDGSFSALLFDGDYKLIIPQGQGPFLQELNPDTHSDTIPVHLSGNQRMDIEVLPYYMIRDPSFTAAGSKVTAVFKIEKTVTDNRAKDVEYAELYVSKTQFVDTRTSIATARVGGGDIADMDHVSLNVDVPARTPAQSYVFARVGLKIAGVEDMIFTPVTRISLE
ncbi:DUF3823 domain-containing protein [Compostibacter hankyongensis]|uniref:DUF3823 domain-containing protein n=1 Tax=Compostibacter hankyongensis TaxID=1007089 RepID=A0ABP8G3B4_9BACT